MQDIILILLIILIDSSKKMLEHAKKILNPDKSTFIDDDFTKINLNKHI